MPAVGDPARERARGVLALAILSNTTAALPAFLLGALAVLVRDDLRFGEGGLGLAVAIFFACSALVAIPGGRLTERIGARAAIALAAVCSAMSLAGVALLAGAWTDLAVFLAIGGVGDGLSQPATNLSLARAVPARRQGLAFGVKQASIPLATLTAGLAVPVIGVTLGWRVAYGLAAFATVPVVALLAARRLRPHERVPRTPRRSPSPQRGVEGSVVWLASSCR